MTKWVNRNRLYRFLSYRCDKNFLLRYIELHPSFISTLSVCSYIFADSDIDVLIRFNELSLLPDKERLRTVSSIKELAVDTPDSGFLNDNIKSLMTDNEFLDIRIFVQNKLLPDLGQQIDSWKYNYDSDDEPEVYFEDLKSSLEDYKKEFEDNANSCQQICEALNTIEQVIEDLRLEYDQSSSDENHFKQKADQETQNEDIRSVFDDVDL